MNIRRPLLRGVTKAIDPGSPSSSDRGDPSTVAGPAEDDRRLPAWKRVLDVSCALIAIPALLPIMTVVALIIKGGSRGPLLFKQERVGHLGKRFVLFKFRTMTDGVDTAVHEKHVAGLIDGDAPMTKLDARGDARLIPFGRLLRASALDELPQLINVLRGEMSFVGPRPCLPSEYDRYVGDEKRRFLTLPGLTGLWQVSGKNRTTFREMIDLDLQYVARRSLALDLKIMLKTLPTVMTELQDLGSPAPPREETPQGSRHGPATGGLPLGGGGT